MSPNVGSVNRKTTDKIVKFCFQCSVQDKCEMCEKRFNMDRGSEDTSPLSTCYQLETDITCLFSERSPDMIADIGCPISLIGIKDEEVFKKSLSQFQQVNLITQKVDEKFNFGPSGPYRCKRRLLFPICDEDKDMLAEVAVVDAKVPMLLGNNLLRPLGATIQLFKTGNGVLTLNDVEIRMKETRGGHYTLKVGDLGKLCEKSQDVDVRNSSKYSRCKLCGNIFKESGGLKKNMERNHKSQDFGETLVVNDNLRSILKKTKISAHKEKEADILKDIEGENSVEKVIKDCNTLLNGSSSDREKKVILAIKNLAKLSQEKKTVTGGNCDETTNNENEFDHHIGDNHEENQINNDIFLSHHAEQFDAEQIELDPVIWNVLFSDNDGKELSIEEEKEILKLHRYFAHRSGRKLWENVFLPAGRFTGKKRLVLKFLEKCEICKKHKRSPPRPKVGLPKAKDVNEVVSIDLKILKKRGKKDIGILYIHDELSKLIKGKVVND